MMSIVPIPTRLTDVTLETARPRISRDRIGQSRGHPVLSRPTSAPAFRTHGFAQPVVRSSTAPSRPD